MTRELFTSKVFHLNDYLFIVGSYDFGIISAIPEKSLNYATMLTAYDVYTWIFIVISVFTVMKYYLVKKAKLRRTNTMLHLNTSEPHSRELVDLLEERGKTNQDLLLPTDQISDIYD